MDEDRLALASNARLQRDEQGAVRLHHHDASYAPDDVVPVAIYPDIPRRSRSRARSFVETAMLRQYGTARQDWPALAREFLAAKAARKK